MHLEGLTSKCKGTTNYCIISGKNKEYQVKYQLPLCYKTWYINRMKNYTEFLLGISLELNVYTECFQLLV